MDPNLLLSLAFVVVVVVIVMSTLAGVAKRAIRLREKRLELEQGQSGPAPELAQLMHKMEDRLRVLERIATQGEAASGDQSLAQEIEALRLTSDAKDQAKEELQ